MAVYEDGRVWNVKQGCWYKLGKDQDGYLVRGTHKVHRLVLLAFVGPARSKSHVCRHLDGNPANNTLSNLAWGTQQQNWDDRRRHGTDLVGRKHSPATLRKMSAARCAYWNRHADH